MKLGIRNAFFEHKALAFGQRSGAHLLHECSFFGRFELLFLGEFFGLLFDLVLFRTSEFQLSIPILLGADGSDVAFKLRTNAAGAAMASRMF
jgi:hypothetical protein